MRSDRGIFLQVHFGPEGVAAQSEGPALVEREAGALSAALDALARQTHREAQQLSAALTQVETYCSDVAALRAGLLRAEQQLRHAAQPAYTRTHPGPHDPQVGPRSRRTLTHTAPRVAQVASVF